MKRMDPALVVVLAGVSAALHVGKLPPALPVLRDALGDRRMGEGSVHGREHRVTDRAGRLKAWRRVFTDRRSFPIA